MLVSLAEQSFVCFSQKRADELTDKKVLGLLLPLCASVSRLHNGPKSCRVPGFTGKPWRPRG